MLGISRVTSHQLVRHRLASYTQQSQRYVTYKRLNYITPPSILARPNFLAQYQQAVQAEDPSMPEYIMTAIWQDLLAVYDILTKVA